MFNRKIFCYQPKRNNKGFTLIELLVVTIIIGILAAVSVPNLLNQIGKARETEAKNGLGTLSRSQQAYHFEKQTFANTVSGLSINANLDSRYYSFPDPGTANSNIVQHQAVAIDPTRDWVRHYASGVYFDAGFYNIVLCQGRAVSESVNAPSASSGNCTNGGIKVQ